jgi:hypothetical protein
MKDITYKKCEWVRLNNRRIQVWEYTDGSFRVCMKNLIGYKNIKITDFQLSREGAEALMICLVGCFGSMSSNLQKFRWNF